MKNLAAALAICLFAAQAHALVPCQVKSYTTAAILTAAAEKDCTIGYAIDTDVFYLRANGAWATLNTVALLANGAVWSNAVDGTTVLTEGGETEQHVVTNNLITLTSDTSATYAFTPAVKFTDDVTLSGGANALTFDTGVSGSSITLKNNSSTGLIVGSSSNTSLATFDTTTGSPKVIISGTAAQNALTVPVGTSSFTETAAFTAGITVGTTAAVTGAITGLRKVITNASFSASAYTVSAPADCGAVIISSSNNNVVTLPATAAGNLGCMVTLVNIGTAGATLASFAPNAADHINGGVMAVYSGTNGLGVNGKNWNNTGATSKVGDYTTVVSNGTASGSWDIIGGIGVWAPTP